MDVRRRLAERRQPRANGDHLDIAPRLAAETFGNVTAEAWRRPVLRQALGRIGRDTAFQPRPWEPRIENLPASADRRQPFGDGALLIPCVHVLLAPALRTQ